MGNEMKLLMALCDALGFEVETEINYHEIDFDIGVTKDEALSCLSDRILKTKGGAYAMNDKGGYISQLESPEVSYKLTRKPAQGGTGGSWPRDGCPQGIGS